MIEKTFYTIGEIFSLSLIAVLLLSILISLLIKSLDGMKNSTLHKVLFTIEVLTLLGVIIYGFYIIMA